LPFECRMGQHFIVRFDVELGEATQHAMIPGRTDCENRHDVYGNWRRVYDDLAIRRQ
jgi:hypothetical protein